VSCAFGADLQAVIYARLTGDPELWDLVGDRIYDAPLDTEEDEGMPEHVTLGEETVRPWSSKTSAGAVHELDVAVHSRRDGFSTAKRIAAAICAALVDAPLAVDAGRVVALRFVRAKAVRGRAPEKRKVTLRFRAVIDQDD
jgi:hypothetical protein